VAAEDEPLSADRRADVLDTDMVGVPRLIPRPPPRYATVFGAAMAVATTVGFLLLPVRPTRRHPPRPLPAYSLVVTGGEGELPGLEPPAVEPRIIRLRPQSRLELALSPATDVRGFVKVSAFVAPKDADGADSIEGVPLGFAIASDGAARASDTAAEIFGSRRGRWQLRVVVARPSVTPDEDETIARAKGSTRKDAQLIAVDLWLLDAP
jgi:hypothetical protein